MKIMKTRLKFVLILLLLTIVGAVSVFFLVGKDGGSSQEIQSLNEEIIDLALVEKKQEKLKKRDEEALKKAKIDQYRLSGVEAEIFESTAEFQIKSDNSLFELKALKRGEGEPVSPWKNLNRVKVKGKVIANSQKNFYTLLTENNEKINFLVSTIADQKDKTYAYHATCEEKDGSYCKACLTSFYLRNSVDLNTNIQYQKQEVRKLNKGEMVSMIFKSISIEETIVPEDYLKVDEKDDTTFFKVISDPGVEEILKKDNWQRLNFIRSTIDTQISDLRENEVYNAIGVIIYEN
jgi:hypothetical protein